MQTCSYSHYPAIRYRLSIWLPAMLWLMVGVAAGQWQIEVEGAGSEESESAPEKASAVTNGEARPVLGEDLRRRLQESSAASGFTTGAEPEEGVGSSPGSVETRTLSLEDTYWYLRVRDGFVLVPRGSVIHWPESLQSLIMDQAKGPRMRWDEFIRSQQNWVVAHPVTLKQIRGEESIDAIKESHKFSRSMVIATYNGNPVGLKGNDDLPQEDNE